MQKPIQSSHKFHIFHLTLLLSGVKKLGVREIFYFFDIKNSHRVPFFGGVHTEKQNRGM